MAYPIFGNPRPQFIDSAGAPYASGAISILDPADDTVKASYPTAADADASTNGTSASLTLNARGQPSQDMWGKDGEDYKHVITDVNAATVDTFDAMRMPGPSRRSTVTFTSTDTTPSVAEGNLFLTNGTTTMTDFDDGQVGDVINVKAAGSIQITDSSAVILRDGLDFNMVAQDSVTLAMLTDQVWNEISRNVRGTGVELTSAKVLVEGDSGKTWFLNSATEFAVTLPAPALGWTGSFIIKGAASSADYTLVTTSGANIMYTYILDIVGEMVYAASRDVVTFVDGGVAGDKADVTCDGTNYYCYGLCGVDGKMTSGQS